MKRIGNLIPVLLYIIFFSSPSFGQTVSTNILKKKVHDYIVKNQHRIINEFVELLSIPNVSDDRPNIRRNAKHIKSQMEQRGIKVKIIKTPGNPVVYGELIVPGAERTLLFYEHYDGQPVDPSKWTDTYPFSPSLRHGKLESGTKIPGPVPFPHTDTPFEEDWRIYARGASDDKAPVTGILTAIDAILASGFKLKNNLKFLFEGEEEAGSPHIETFCRENKDLLKADVMFICDGPVYYSGDPTLFFGVRGITGMEITVYGPNTSLHSGHYGNWAPNPGLRLVKLLNSMKSADGKVQIKGFYDSVTPLSENEKNALAKIPQHDENIKELYGFSSPEGGGRTLMEMIQLPSLNFRGLSSGWTGSQARTIVPAKAAVSIDIRLVKGNKPEKMVQKVLSHIREQGYYIVREDPGKAERTKYPLIAKVRYGGGYPAYRASMDLLVSKQVVKTLKGFYGKGLVTLPTLGGSLPLYAINKVLQIPLIGLPIANFDNNQHQPDENIRIGHFWNGIKTFAALIMMDEL